MAGSTTKSDAAAGRAEPGRLLSILTSGLVVAIFEVVAAASMAALIFSGDLTGYVASGIGLALFGAIVTGVMVAVLGSLPGTVGGVQDAPAAVMAVIAASIAASMPSGAAADELFLTVVATITITALVTGACLLGLGYFRLGNLVRFLPYPVVGGFLAGTGWLLVSGALAMMSGLDLTLANLPTLFGPELLIKWLPGVIWAVIAFLAMRRYSHPLLLPGLIFAGIMLFYAAAWLGDATTVQLRAQGLLLGPIPDGQMWRPLSAADLEHVSWSVVLRQAPGIATIVILSMIGVLLNASGLEVTYRKEMALNRELRAAGVGNVLAGAGAGLVGFQQLSGSALAFGLRAPSRWVGLIAATLCALVLLLGGTTLSLFPQAVLGGLLFLIGFSFLYEWLVEAWYKLPHRDYVIVLAILLLTIVIGFLQAVVAGLLIAVVLFVVSYSWSDVVRAELNGTTYHSRVARSRRQRQLLDQVGEQLYILELQGFIFFGTANGINEHVRRRFDDPGRPMARLVILDFSRVTGLDSTASLSFAKLLQTAASQDVRLAITAPSSTIWRQLLQAGLCEPGDGFVVFASLDKGAEWCEDQLLASLDTGGDETGLSLPEQLAEVLGDSTGIAELMTFAERLEVEAGYRLVNRGDPADTLYFVESGRVTAQLSQDKEASIRLEAMGSGHVVGEIGFYLGGQRTADVIADEPSVLFRLSMADLPRMSKENPQAATALHRLVAILLAERVAHLTAVVEAAERR